MSKLTKLFSVLRTTNSGIGIFNNWMAFLTHTSTIVGNLMSGAVAVFAVVGTTSSGRSSRALLDVANMQFALRFVLLMVIAAAMGWALGALVSWLTEARKLSEARRVISYFVAAVTGGLLIFSADWLSLERRGGGLPELEVLTCLGMAVALWVASFQFRLHVGSGVREVIKVRSMSLTVFVSLCILLLGLTMAGQA